MYILVSVTVISFLGMLGLFLYRLWEIKKGKVIVSEYTDSTHETPEMVYYFCRDCAKKTFLFIKHHLPWYKEKFIGVTNTVANSSNATMFRNLINGKKKIGNDKSSSSLYLKDITEHKNNIKQSKE